MLQNVKLENTGELQDFQEYDKDKMAIAKVCVLSTDRNSHGLDISEEVLRRDIGTIRGNFLVAHMVGGDAHSHDEEEVPVGYFIPDRDIEFEEIQKNGRKIVRAWAFAILSKQYAKEAYNMFVNDNHRATSIEMRVDVDDDGHTVLGFDAYGSTILGKGIKPSCGDAEISLVRFAQEAQDFFDKKSDSLEILKEFAETRRQSMNDGKTYKIDKSKDALSFDDWSDVDKTELRNKILEAKNKFTLVKSVYLDVEDDWESAPSEKLKYPVMQLKGDTFVYNRNALASALSYGKANDESSVVDKVEKIYKKLGLDDTERKEEAKMEETKMAETETKVEEKPNETEMAEIEGRKAWGKVIEKVQEHEGEGAYVDSIEDNHIIYTKDDVRYRVEADVKVGEDDKEVDADIKWDTVKKDADQKMSEEEIPCEMSLEDAKAEIDRLSTEIENRDNIIMGKDKEIADLTEFKQKVLEKERAITVEATMAEIKDYVDNLTYNDIREEGLNCKFDEIDGWVNKAKAICFGAVKKTRQRNNGDTGVWSFAAPIEPVKKTTSIWN